MEISIYQPYEAKYFYLQHLYKFLTEIFKIKEIQKATSVKLTPFNYEKYRDKIIIIQGINRRISLSIEHIEVKNSLDFYFRTKIESKKESEENYTILGYTHKKCSFTEKEFDIVLDEIFTFLAIPLI